jgi:hypothetical protein
MHQKNGSSNGFYPEIEGVELAHSFLVYGRQTIHPTIQPSMQPSNQPSKKPISNNSLQQSIQQYKLQFTSSIAKTSSQTNRDYEFFHGKSVGFKKVIPPLELLLHRYEKFVAKEYSKELVGALNADAANSKPSSI